MIKVLSNKIKNCDRTLDSLLLKRKNKIQIDSVFVTKIVKDVKRNGDKAIFEI